MWCRDRKPSRPSPLQRSTTAWDRSYSGSKNGTDARRSKVLCSRWNSPRYSPAADAAADRSRKDSVLGRPPSHWVGVRSTNRAAASTRNVAACGHPSRSTASRNEPMMSRCCEQWRWASDAEAVFALFNSSVAQRAARRSSTPSSRTNPCGTRMESQWGAEPRGEARGYASCTSVLCARGFTVWPP